MYHEGQGKKKQKKHDFTAHEFIPCKPFAAVAEQRLTAYSNELPQFLEAFGPLDCFPKGFSHKDLRGGGQRASFMLRRARDLSQKRSVGKKHTHTHALCTQGGAPRNEEFQVFGSHLAPRL